jgi:hypothetical protein
MLHSSGNNLFLHAVQVTLIGLDRFRVQRVLRHGNGRVKLTHPGRVKLTHLGL